MTELEWLSKFGENLSQLLKNARMSQIELANVVGLSKSAINNYIHGRQMPTIRAVINICYELGCDTDELIDFNERIIK